MPAEGFKIADAYVEIVANVDRNQVRRAVDSAVTEAGPGIQRDAESSLGRFLADGISAGFSKSFGVKLKTSFTNMKEEVTDNSRKTIGRAILDGIGAAFSSTLDFGKSILSGLTSVASTLAVPTLIGIGVAIAAGLGLGIASALAAAITTALGLGIGGGLLGLGVLLLKENKKLVRQFEKSWSSIKKIMTAAAEPLLGPFIQALKDVEKLVKGLAPDFKELFTGGGKLVPLLTTGLAGFLTPILAGLKEAMPGITAAFAGLTKTMPILGESIGRFFATIFRDGPLVEKVTATLVRFFAWLFDVAGPGLLNLTYIFGGFTNLMRLFSIGFDQIWANLASHFDAGTGAVNRMRDAWGPLADQVRRVWTAFKEFAVADDDKIIGQKFITLVQEIKRLWAPLKEFLGVVWDEAWAFLGRIWETKVVPWWNTTVRPWLLTEIKGVTRAAFKMAVDAAVEEFSKLPTAVLNTVRGLPGQLQSTIVNGFSGSGGWLVNAGQQIIAGLVQGIKNALGSLRAVLSTVTNSIPAWKGPMAKDKKLLVPTGKAIMGGLEEGIQSQVRSLSSLLGGITAAIPAMSRPAPAAPAQASVHVENLNITGTWDLTDPAALRRLVALLTEALANYTKEYA